ncbi:hypothetical protein KIN20_018839 [Parelaphostrongylus tenuis]|uniref:Uncharacterized protein n=1 Tax=Parelaphostrongylus tenuis TaxID=148309 RepID=A0AAD5N4Q8_PARTN|nr:hypothetical protein KIN20_018839 [Parelaphostrongylus tenuis]
MREHRVVSLPLTLAACQPSFGLSNNKLLTSSKTVLFYWMSVRVIKYYKISAFQQLYHSTLLAKLIPFWFYSKPCLRMLIRALRSAEDNYPEVSDWELRDTCLFTAVQQVLGNRFYRLHGHLELLNSRVSKQMPFNNRNSAYAFPVIMDDIHGKYLDGQEGIRCVDRAPKATWK